MNNLTAPGKKSAGMTRVPAEAAKNTRIVANLELPE